MNPDDILQLQNTIRIYRKDGSTDMEIIEDILGWDPEENPINCPCCAP